MIHPLALLLAFQIGPACPADLDLIYPQPAPPIGKEGLHSLRP